MTTLEIIRLDSHASNRLSLSSSPSKTNNASELNTSSSKQTSVKASQNVCEIPINIIKSPSFHNQHDEDKEKSRTISATSGKSIQHLDDDVDGKNQLDVSYNDSEYNYNATKENENNTGTLRFNKYGFVQPSNENNNNNNASHNSLSKKNDQDSLKGGAASSLVVTNLKDYLQNADVEYFSENIPIKVIQLREVKWIGMLNNFDVYMSKKFTKIKSRCRKGIPQSMRSKAWMHLTGAFLLKKQKPNYFNECLQNPNNLDINKYIEDIKKDLHRQFPNHEIFMKKEGRLKLFNVLKAYAVHNKEVGYCQAQGPIAALLLMHMVEEDAFWMLIRISDTYLKEYFKPGLEKVQIDGYALFYLFKKENSTAHKVMKQQSIDPILYMTEWFMCIFARTLPWCTVLRVWDMFFCEGIKVLYRVGLYLMINAFSNKQNFIKCQQQGMYETLNLLKNLPIDCLTEENLVKKSCLIKIDENTLNNAFEKSKIQFIKQTNELNENRKQAPNFKNANKKN